MQKLLLAVIFMICAVIYCSGAEQITLKLTDGTTITGEIGKSSFNADGVALIQSGGMYGRRIPWKNLSQESLKKLANNPDAQKYVEPYIEFEIDVKPKERPAPKVINFKPVPKIERPKPVSMFSALFQSPVTIAFLLLIYLANIYAGYEVAIFKNRPAILVCAVSAILPCLGLIIFLVLPAVPPKPAEELAEEVAEGVVEEAEQINGQGQESVVQTIEQTQETKPAEPQVISYLRGQYTFNRRFFETKFAGFIGPVKSEEVKDKVVEVVTLRGTYVADRFTKLMPNEIFLLVKKGDASEEVMIPFVEIREIHIKHADMV